MVRNRLRQLTTYLLTTHQHYSCLKAATIGARIVATTAPASAIKPAKKTVAKRMPISTQGTCPPIPAKWGATAKRAANVPPAKPQTKRDPFSTKIIQLIARFR
jgi:hypothetical protein